MRVVKNDADSWEGLSWREEHGRPGCGGGYQRGQAGVRGPAQQRHNSGCQLRTCRATTVVAACLNALPCAPPHHTHNRVQARFLKGHDGVARQIGENSKEFAQAHLNEEARMCYVKVRTLAGRPGAAPGRQCGWLGGLPAAAGKPPAWEARMGCVTVRRCQPCTPPRCLPRRCAGPLVWWICRSGSAVACAALLLPLLLTRGVRLPGPPPSLQVLFEEYKKLFRYEPKLDNFPYTVMNLD